MPLTDRERELARFAFVTGWMSSMGLAVDEGYAFLNAHGLGAIVRPVFDAAEGDELSRVLAKLWDLLAKDRVGVNR